MARRTQKRKPKPKLTTKRLTSEAAVRALASPLRMEIAQSFVHGDRLTVRDLAERLDRERGSLYYHVRKLAEIGVLVEVERVLVGRRYEAVYEVAADRIAVETDTATASGRAAVAKLVRSTLRQAGREFDAALEAGYLDLEEGPEVGRRQRVRLDAKDLAEVSSCFAQIEEICMRAAKRGTGRLYAVTSLVVPLSDD